MKGAGSWQQYKTEAQSIPNISACPYLFIEHTNQHLDMQMYLQKSMYKTDTRTLIQRREKKKKQKQERKQLEFGALILTHNRTTYLNLDQKSKTTSNNMKY